MKKAGIAASPFLILRNYKDHYSSWYSLTLIPFLSIFT